MMEEYDEYDNPAIITLDDLEDQSEDDGDMNVLGDKINIPIENTGSGAYSCDISFTDKKSKLSLSYTKLKKDKEKKNHVKLDVTQEDLDKENQHVQLDVKQSRSGRALKQKVQSDFILSSNVRAFRSERRQSIEE